jgi:hypothetical protein
MVQKKIELLGEKNTFKEWNVKENVEEMLR